MSVWSSAEGWIETRFSSHISLEKVFRNVFYGGELEINRLDSNKFGGIIRHDFNIRFCYDGMDAALKIREVLDEVNFVGYEISSNIRW